MIESSCHGYVNRAGWLRFVVETQLRRQAIIVNIKTLKGPVDINQAANRCDFNLTAPGPHILQSTPFGSQAFSSYAGDLKIARPFRVSPAGTGC